MLSRDTRREFDAQIGGTIRSLQRHAAPLQEVHSIRSALTEMRASLRLLRTCLRDDTYHSCNRAIRDAERELAAVRDAEVVVVTVGQLRRTTDTIRFKRAIGALLQTLVEERNATRTRRHIAREMIVSLRAIRSVVKKELRPQLVGAASATGLLGTYGQCRRSFHRAQRRPTDMRLHAWRKQIKYLYCQTDELSRLKIANIPDLNRRASRLAGYLGQDHDLAVLQSRMSDLQLCAQVESGPDFIQELLQRVHRRRAGLQRNAMRLGRKCFEERPKRFRVRLARYWQGAA